MDLTVEEFQQLQDELNALRLDKAEAESENLRLKKTLDSGKTGGGAGTQKSSGIFGELSDAVSSFRNNDSSVHGQEQAATIEVLRSQLMALKENLREQFTTNQTLAKELQELRDGASPADDPTSETQTQLNEKDEKVKALASTIAEMERERDTTQEENKKLGLETKALQEKVDVFVEQGQQKDKDIEHDKRLAEEKRVSEQETNASDRLQAIEGAVAAAKEALSAEHAKHMQQYTSDKETEYQSEKEGLLKQIEALRSIVHDGQADGTTDTGDGNRELDTQIQELQTELVSKDEKIAKLLAQSKTLTTKLVTQARLEKALNAEIAALNERSTHFDSTAQHNSVNGALENGEANQQQAMAEETQRRFDEAQQTLAQKIEEIETLTATNKSLVAERDVFAGKVSSLESERIQLKSDSDKWKSEKSASEAELSAIGQERDTLKQDTEQERDTLQQEIAKEKDDHAKALEELVREKDSVTEELAGKVSELESEQARFKQDSDRWESEKSTLETEIRAVVQERDSLKQDTEHERDTLKQAIEQERDTLQRDMAKEKDDHAKALEELVRERDAMKESHTTLETQIEGTAKTLERAKRIEEKVGQLESDREKLETEVYNKTTELYELTTEVRGLRVQCAGMDALKTELAQAKQRVSRLTTEVQEKSELYDSSHAQLSSVKETLHARVREVEEQATMNLLALEKVEAELADEKANSKRLLREKQEATSLLKATKSTVEIEKKSLADVKKELADMSEAHASALKSKLQLTEQVEARNAEIDALVREKQVQENDYMEKLNALRTSTSDERQKMVEEHSKLLQEMDRSRKAISDDLADARSEYAVLQTERDGLVERVRVLEAEAATTAAVVEENCAAIAQAKADAERAQDAYESEVAVLSQKVDDSQRRIAELRATHEALRVAKEKDDNARRLIERKNMGLIKELKRDIRQQQNTIQKLESEVMEKRGSQASSPFQRSRRDSGDTLSAYDYALPSSSPYSNSSTYRAESPHLQMTTEEHLPTLRAHRNTHKDTPLRVYDDDDGSDGNGEMQTMEKNLAKLVSRVATLQCAADVSRERVEYLEEANASLMKDLEDKTALIKTYVMENKAGRNITRQNSTKPGRATGESEDATYKKQASDVADKFSAVMSRLSTTTNNNDMFKRIQAMLEESLTKNVQLQSSLELLSKENEELRARSM